MNAQTSC